MGDVEARVDGEIDGSERRSDKGTKREGGAGVEMCFVGGTEAEEGTGMRGDDNVGSTADGEGMMMLVVGLAKGEEMSAVLRLH